MFFQFVLSQLPFLDIREWTIELRENDLTMDEQNIQNKEKLFKTKSNEYKENQCKFLKNIEMRERVLDEKMQEIATLKNDLLNRYILENKNNFDRSDVVLQLKFAKNERGTEVYIQNCKGNSRSRKIYIGIAKLSQV